MKGNHIKKVLISAATIAACSDSYGASGLCG